jgi:hypothetical protein
MTGSRRVPSAFRQVPVAFALWPLDGHDSPRRTASDHHRIQPEPAHRFGGLFAVSLGGVGSQAERVPRPRSAMTGSSRVARRAGT